jgi:hypothetical protein
MYQNSNIELTEEIDVLREQMSNISQNLYQASSARDLQLREI